jgi:hypothetical protein
MQAGKFGEVIELHDVVFCSGKYISVLKADDLTPIQQAQQRKPRERYNVHVQVELLDRNFKALNTGRVGCESRSAETGEAGSGRRNEEDSQSRMAPGNFHIPLRISASQVPKSYQVLQLLSLL